MSHCTKMPASYIISLCHARIMLNLKSDQYTKDVI